MITDYFCFSLISNAPQTEEREDDLHSSPARRSGKPVLQDPLPRYLYARGGGPEDQPARVQSPGENPTRAVTPPTHIDHDRESTSDDFTYIQLNCIFK